MLHQRISLDGTAAVARTFTVSYEPTPYRSAARFGMPWVLRRYGQGACTLANGNPNHFATKDAADAAGSRWLETGVAA